MEIQVLSWPLNEKRIVWLANSNKYIVAEPPVADIIRRIAEKEDMDSIVQLCTEKYQLPTKQASEFLNEIDRCVDEYLVPVSSNEKTIIRASSPVFASTKYYSIYKKTFLVEYETEELEMLIHPKFEYLEVSAVQNHDHHFQVVNHEGHCSLIVDNQTIGTWPIADSHFLGGKFSMQVLQKIYKKEENDWMAVFHAAGISDGEDCLIFLGDSGNGKSTLSAILMASGLEVLADDFLPVESESGLVCHFPAAISIKNKAYQMLIPVFPELQNACEFINPAFGKTFRYLSSTGKNPLSVQCKGLVFVKYEQDSGFRFEEMTGEEAFAHLVPDSWISPTAENANRFISWFISQKYYRMTYSDNEKMVHKVKEILNDDL